MMGERILIVGTSASGKTTFARKLAEKTLLPVTYMDALMWKPGWEYLGDEQTVEKIREAAQGDRWIIEGFMFEELIPELLDRATTIIYLDYSQWLLVWRYVKRTWKHRREARSEIPDCPDSFSFSFMWRIFMKKEVYWLEAAFKDRKYDAKLIRCQRPKDLANLL